MSDKTFGVKVSEELYEKVKGMIDVSGISSKEWFEKAVALTAAQNLKEGNTAYKQDLSELEIHTTRIYELVANMIQRSEYMKMDAVKELEEKLDSREFTITELQGNAKKLTEDNKLLEERIEQADVDKKDLAEQVKTLNSTNSNNQDLIQEYKEKIDTLSSLVNEYKGYAKENAEMKATHAAEKERMASLVDELRDSARDLLTTNEQLQDKLDTTKQEHKNEVERILEFNQKELQRVEVNYNNQLAQLNDKKDLEKERAVLEIERKYQDKIERIQEEYNNRIASLYEKLDQNKEAATPKNKKKEQ